MPLKGKKPKRSSRPSPLERMREAFELVNLDADATISREEFRVAMQGIGIGMETADQLFQRFDTDNTGELDKEEFFAYAAKGSGEVRSLIRKGVIDEDQDPALDKVIEVFKAWDRDGDGTIGRAELERVLIVLNPTFTKKEMDKFMKAADRNGDGVIDYQEFTDWLHDASKPARGTR
mmetsp:Transcript_112044/g.311926  ORF Transcript_112044/g.311926 Transcript_112044/m.311926 type:complete len:177 (+) Transcript_112044:78-608(+)